MKFVLTGNYDEVLTRLFKVGEDGGRVSIGTARTREPMSDLDRLEDWTLFSDYVMEGFVTYYLRLSRQSEGAVLEVRFTGTNRDGYIPFALRDYIKWAGLEAEQG